MPAPRSMRFSAVSGPLPAGFATDKDILRKSRIYIAPPDRHLIVNDDRLSLGEGPRENNVRPAIDPMLRSAAACCGGRTIGVVLTGTLDDGARGRWAVGQCGGMTVVQDPKDAAFAEMPLTALNRAKPDHVVRARCAPLSVLPWRANCTIRRPTVAIGCWPSTGPSGRKNFRLRWKYSATRSAAWTGSPQNPSGRKQQRSDGSGFCLLDVSWPKSFNSSVPR